MSQDLAMLHRQVCFGQSGGKIIWQPRIGCWYSDKKFAREAFPPPFTDMDIHDIYRELGCSARLYNFNACFKRTEAPEVTWHSKPINETDTQHVVDTPAGRQVASVPSVRSGSDRQLIPLPRR